MMMITMLLAQDGTEDEGQQCRDGPFRQLVHKRGTGCVLDHGSRSNAEALTLQRRVECAIRAAVSCVSCPLGPACLCRRPSKAPNETKQNGSERERCCAKVRRRE